MASEGPSEASQRANELATQATSLLAVGDIAGAHRLLQEAVHLAPETPSVKEAFSKLQVQEGEHALIRLCKRFIFERDEKSGQEVITLLQGSEKVSDEVARTCSQLLLAKGAENNPKIKDSLLYALVRRTKGAKITLAEKFQSPALTTRSFEEVYEFGDGGADSIIIVMLSPEAWDSEDLRTRAEKDVFRLYLAKLLEAGDDDDGRAMRGISRLLATDVENLQELIDDDTFDAISSALDYRHSISIKSPATLAISKFLEASGQRGQQMLVQYVTSHFAKQHTEDMILAFSAAAAIFPIATSTAANMLLTPGFLPSLIPLLERKAHSKEARVAALEMLSAACVDSTCRENIRTHCFDWVQRIARENEAQMSALAAVVMSKVQGTPGDGDKSSGAEQAANTEILVRKLIQLLFDNPKENRVAAFEGLAHQSVRPRVKEKLVHDKQFLEIFFQEIKRADANSPTVFGGLSILDNITAYPPVLTEEQKRVAQLKAYANALPKSSEIDVLNDGKAVTRRCEMLVAAGLVPVLVEMQKQLPQSGIALVVKIFLSLSQTPKLRGRIVQQGAVKVLASRWAHIEGSSAASESAQQNASQALARLLISVDPTILFGYSGNALLQSSISALISLLHQPEGFVTDGPRNLLPTFEALLALTNLCSVPRNGASPKIIKEARADVEDLMLSNNANIRRAATELITNLVQHPDGIALYADGSAEASRRLHILLALAGSEDLSTRKAAGGALASLTDTNEILDAINKQSRGTELLLAIISDEDEEVIHRGLVCILNVISNKEGAGKITMGKLRDMGITSKLQDTTKNVYSPDVQGLLSQALLLLK